MTAPVVAMIAAQIVMREYDLVRALAVTAGMVKSDRSNTMPMILIAITMVTATIMDIIYDMTFVLMPWLAANCLSKAKYIIPRHHAL